MESVDRGRGHTVLNFLLHTSQRNVSRESEARIGIAKIGISQKTRCWSFVVDRQNKARANFFFGFQVGGCKSDIPINTPE
jgi:hypothetical protein